jgi:hypothetical protein
MALQQADVPKVGFPCEVEQVSDEGDGTQDGIEHHVTGDADERSARRAKSDRFYKDPPSKNGASSIAGAGD